MNRAFFMHFFMEQLFNHYTTEDRMVWKKLFERQAKNLGNKACQPYLLCLEKLSNTLHPNEVVKFSELDAELLQNTQWSIEVVRGLIPVEHFFQLLAQKKFCSSTWLRNLDQLDYLEEPDMFHDIFGHIPLLMDETFASFMQFFGQLGLDHLSHPDRVLQLQRLYWFTIEFGLIQEKQVSKIFGAGIISSFGETNHVMSDKIQAEEFDIERIMHTSFRTDQIQTLYFSIPSFETLYDALTSYQFKSFSTSYSYS